MPKLAMSLALVFMHLKSQATGKSISNRLLKTHGIDKVLMVRIEWDLISNNFMMLMLFCFVASSRGVGPKQASGDH